MQLFLGMKLVYYMQYKLRYGSSRHPGGQFYLNSLQCSAKSQAKLKALQIMPMLLGRLDYHITAEFIRISVNLLLRLTRETDDSLYRSSRATLHQVSETSAKLLRLSISQRASSHRL